MGGSGSGWRWAKKPTVEGSLRLSISALVRKKALLVRLGWFGLVHVKSDVAQEVRTLLVNRNLLLGIAGYRELGRGSLKVFEPRLGSNQALFRDSSS
jgi:hypothetical protein